MATGNQASQTKRTKYKKNWEQNKWSPISINNHTKVSFSSHCSPLFHFNTAYWTGPCTFPTSYTQCFFYYRIASTMNFNRCQRTSIFTYSAGSTAFFIDTCHSFCQCFVLLSNLVSLLYLKKVNSSVILLHKNLPWPLITKKTYFYYTSPLYLYMMFIISSVVLIISFCFSFTIIDLLSSSDTVQLTNWHSTV